MKPKTSYVTHTECQTTRHKFANDMTELTGKLYESMHNMETDIVKIKTNMEADSKLKKITAAEFDIWKWVLIVILGGMFGFLSYWGNDYINYKMDNINKMNALQTQINSLQTQVEQTPYKTVELLKNNYHVTQ